MILKPPHSQAGALLLGWPSLENPRYQMIQLEFPVNNGDNSARV